MQRRSIYSTETHTDEKKQRDEVGTIEQRMLMRRCDENIAMPVFGRRCCGFLLNLSSDVGMACMAGRTDVPTVMSDRQVPVDLHDFHCLVPAISTSRALADNDRQFAFVLRSQAMPLPSAVVLTHCRTRYRGTIIHVPAQPSWTSLKLALFAR